MTPRPRHNTALGRSRAARGAFTMIELIVVSVLMVVLAAVVVPRVVGAESRRARVLAEAVRDLLTAAGDREAMTSQDVTLAFDGDSNGAGRLSLLSVSQPGEAPVSDPLTNPVVLDGLTVESCSAAGVRLSPQRWRIPLREGDIRPSIAIVLRRPDGDGWLVSLSSEAASATLIELAAKEVAPVGVSGAIDLDRIGRSGEAW